MRELAQSRGRFMLGAGSLLGLAACSGGSGSIAAISGSGSQSLSSSRVAVALPTFVMEDSISELAERVGVSAYVENGKVYKSKNFAKLTGPRIQTHVNAHAASGIVGYGNSTPCSGDNCTGGQGDDGDNDWSTVATITSGQLIGANGLPYGSWVNYSSNNGYSAAYQPFGSTFVSGVQYYRQNFMKRPAACMTASARWQRRALRS